MVEQLVLHIGTHKTGTTSIQAALKSSVSSLEEHGIIYPVAGRGPLSGHHNFVWGLKGRPRYSPELGGIEELAREAHDARADVVVVSSETFTDGAWDTGLVDLAERLQTTLRASDVRVQAYVRPQWDYMESNYVQLARRGYLSRAFSEHVDMSLDHWRFDYEAVFSLWRERFGHRLQVRPYGPEIVERFWAAVPALSDVSRPAGEPRRNVRAGRLLVGMMRSLRGILEVRQVPLPEIQKVMAEGLNFLKAVLPEDEPYRGLSRALVERIREGFWESNSRFTKEFMEPDVGNFLLEPTGSYEPNDWTYDEATSEERNLFDSLIREVTTRV